jgi:glyoxylase-like metal-dependent hydrolase (beta-lactamase superfamily II)
MSQHLPAFLEALGHGIYAVDTGFHRPRFDAAYLLVQDGRAAFVDTGTHHAVPRLLASLDALGLARSAVDWVIPTHVHLDHAGGVGRLMRELPNARLLVHPRGARHMIDPSALWAGATAVYGLEEMVRSYGEWVPVPAERVMSSSDGLTVQLASRPLLLIDTPGHAKHHHCIWDAVSQGWFTGDTFGLSYREFDTAKGAWIMPTSTPVQFEPEALQDSVQRLLAQAPQSIYVTHYGRVGDVPRLGALLLSLLSEMVALGRAQAHKSAQNAAQNAARHEVLKEGQLEIFARSLAAHGCDFSREKIAQLLKMDLELNAQGMAVWLDRESTPATKTGAAA